MNGARLKHYGWGREGEGMTEAEQAFVLGRYCAKFARDQFETVEVPRLEALELQASRCAGSAVLRCVALLVTREIGESHDYSPSAWMIRERVPGSSGLQGFRVLARQSQQRDYCET